MRDVRRLRRVAGAVAGALTATMAISACAVTSVRPEVAAYLETTGPHPTNLDAAVSSHALKSFTAAFILGIGCTPTWDDYSPLATATALNAVVMRAKAKGASPIISFGGAAGSDLAKTCGNPAKLATAYTAVIKQFGVTRIDFDVEGAALTDAATNSLRFAAIKALEKSYPTLEVSVTVPVARTGLDSAGGLGFLQSAKQAGARLDVVNIMTMDYGEPISDMGAASVASAKGALPQLKRIWPTMTYRNLGITPMIGRNDTPGETFTLANAQTVTAFAKANGVGRLAFWSINRDQKGSAGEAVGSSTGVNQNPLAFLDAFQK